ncbi:hypothetical protein DFA_06810 [Cavenderia fasciculata]|uniref:Myotubularin phosphatase domain-containing protein n=1 Tax=Cavenderia fasciculata TaxID=261658 RepID=F4Q2C3_CACFS|nr:uncharacterized protein DFA_06810 [Cavenderia fasciculata]EGG18143.1 hypothetical protein DFA_06810 [Cavenderia fasciculata]|eukprot:XP_004366184.1 hypothetical protein DFA_06810 [Cavenderia fasciculata]
MDDPISEETSNNNINDDIIVESSSKSIDNDEVVVAEESSSSSASALPLPLPSLESSTSTSTPTTTTTETPNNNILKIVELLNNVTLSSNNNNIQSSDNSSNHSDQQYTLFKNYVKGLNDMTYHRMLSCQSAIRNYRRSYTASLGPSDMLKNARAIYDNYLDKSLIPLDSSLRATVKFLASPLGGSANSSGTRSIDNILNNSGGGLFTNSGYESGLFSSLTSPTESNNNNNESSSSSPSNSGFQPINNNNNTVNTNTNSPTSSIDSNQLLNEMEILNRITINLFDAVEEYILQKLEVEYIKFINYQHSNQNNQNNNSISPIQDVISPLSPLQPLTTTTTTTTTTSTSTSSTSSSTLSKNNILENEISKGQQTNHYYINNNNVQQQKKLDFFKLAGELVERDNYPMYYIDNLTGETIPSQLYLTTFRFVIVSKLTNQELISVPLAMIYRIDRTNTFRIDQVISMWCKDFRRVDFFIIPREVYPSAEPSPQQDHTIPLIMRLRSIAFQDASQLFAYRFQMDPKQMTDGDGWKVYDTFSEFIRQNLDFQLWRPSEINCEYANATYPSRLFVPYLIAILDALYSCQYGTFLGNTEKERGQIKLRTVSLWSFLNTVKHYFINPFYNAAKTSHPKIPTAQTWRSEHIQLWRNYYLRYWRNPLKEPVSFKNISLDLKSENEELKKKIEMLETLNRQLIQQQVNNIQSEFSKDKDKEKEKDKQQHSTDEITTTTTPQDSKQQ